MLKRIAKLFRRGDRYHYYYHGQQLSDSLEREILKTRFRLY